MLVNTYLYIFMNFNCKKKIRNPKTLINLGNFSATFQLCKNN